MPIEISCSKKLLVFGTVMMSLQCLYLCTSQDWIFFGKILNLSPFHFPFFAISVSNTDALPGQLDVGSGLAKI